MSRSVRRRKFFQGSVRDTLLLARSLSFSFCFASLSLLPSVCSTSLNMSTASEKLQQINNLIDSIVVFCRSRGEKELKGWGTSTKNWVLKYVTMRDQAIRNLEWVKSRVERGEPIMIVSSHRPKVVSIRRLTALRTVNGKYHAPQYFFRSRSRVLCQFQVDPAHSQYSAFRTPLSVS